MWYSNLEKTFISWHILHQHAYTCPSRYQCVETRSMEVFDCYLSHIRTSVSNSSRHQRNVCYSVLNRFARQTLPTVKSKYFFMNVLCTESFCPKRRTTERCSSVVYSQVWSPFRLLKPASEHVHARLLARLSRSWTVLYLVIHIVNLLRPLQLFYFHLWHIYWLAFIVCSSLGVVSAKYGRKESPRYFNVPRMFPALRKS
jgi:hypothetical protein